MIFVFKVASGAENEKHSGRLEKKKKD